MQVGAGRDDEGPGVAVGVQVAERDHADSVAGQQPDLVNQAAWARTGSRPSVAGKRWRASPRGTGSVCHCGNCGVAGLSAIWATTRVAGAWVSWTMPADLRALPIISPAASPARPVASHAAVNSRPQAAARPDSGARPGRTSRSRPRPPGDPDRIGGKLRRRSGPPRAGAPGGFSRALAPGQLDDLGEPGQDSARQRGQVSGVLGVARVPAVAQRPQVGSPGRCANTVGLQPGPQPLQAYAADVALPQCREAARGRVGNFLVRQIRIERQDHH